MDDNFFQDCGWVVALNRGGMATEARRLLFVLADEQRPFAKSHNDQSARIHYLVEGLLPEIGGRPSHLPAWVVAKSQWHARDISWVDWLSRFPGTSVEALEDRQGGATMEVRDVSAKTDADYLAVRAGVFYSPNGFNAEPAEGKKRRRSKGNLLCLNALFVDLDGGDKAWMRRKIDAFPVVPSLVVETKNGFHVIWLLDRSEGPEGQNVWVETQKGLIAQFDADEACSDTSRLLRMPSSWHCKGLFTGGKAYRVSLVLDTGLKYPLSAFGGYRARKPEYAASSVSIASDAVLYVPTTTGVPKDSRHATLKAEAGRVYQSAGEHRERAPECRETVIAWYSTACLDRKDGWEDEANAVCDWMEAEQFGG